MAVQKSLQPKAMIRILIVCFAACGFMEENGWAQSTGVSRVWSTTPPVGVHPRLVMNSNEIADLRNRLTNTSCGKKAMTSINGFVSGYTNTNQLVAILASLKDATDPTSTQVDTYWKADEMRNIAMFCVGLKGIVDNDAALRQMSRDAAVGYSRLILRARQIGTNTVWTTNAWSKTTGWIMGDLGLAMTYDFLYNEMSEADREIVRSAIATAISNRVSFGMDLADGRIVSNHALYHGALPMLALAIEGETNNTPATQAYISNTYAKWTNMTRRFMEQEIYASGACLEDAYPFATAFRDSSALFVAMARRPNDGTNFFKHPNFTNHARYILQSIQPFTNGIFTGHGSGDFVPYPGYPVTARYALPEDPAFNALWRWYTWEGYDNTDWIGRAQSYIELGLFASDWSTSSSISSLGLPQSVNYPERGLTIARSDATTNALYVHFDARPDGFFAGHDNVDRGTFTLCALGRSWVGDLDWLNFLNSDEHSIVHVDGLAQPWKAPAAKTTLYTNDSTRMVVSADLKYAYDWKYPSPNPWPLMTTNYTPPWEDELSNPFDLGLPRTADGQPWPGLEWIPTNISYQPNFGYAGLRYGRAPYNQMSRANRTLLLRRTSRPYLLVLDDVVKDSLPRKYEWFLQLEGDLTLDSSVHAGSIQTNTALANIILSNKTVTNGITLTNLVIAATNRVILAPQDSADNRRLMVLAVPPMQGWGTSVPSVLLELNYVSSQKAGKGANVNSQITGCRMRFIRNGVVDPQFRVMLFPYRIGESMPTASLLNQNQVLAVQDGSQQEFLGLSYGTNQVSVAPMTSAIPGDADGDGVADLLEYALGGSVSTSDGGVLPQFQHDGQGLRLTCVIRTNDPTLNAWGETSWNLSDTNSWSSAGVQKLSGISQTNVAPGFERQTWWTDSASGVFENYLIANTGQDAAFSLQTNGVLSSTWTVKKPGSSTFTSAYVITNNSAWLTNGTNSKWIGPASSGSGNSAIGTYTYRTFFDLTGVVTNQLKIYFRISADNTLLATRLNGTNVNLSGGSYNQWLPSSAATNVLFGFQLTNGFLPGTNALEFDVSNGTSGRNNPTGFQAQFMVEQEIDRKFIRLKINLQNH